MVLPPQRLFRLGFSEHLFRHVLLAVLQTLEMPSTNIVEFLLQPKALLDQLVTLKSLISTLPPLLLSGDCHQAGRSASDGS